MTLKDSTPSNNPFPVNSYEVCMKLTGNEEEEKEDKEKTLSETEKEEIVKEESESNST